ALAYDSVRVCVRGVSREGGRCRLLFLLLFLCPRAFGSFARGELASVAPSGLAPLLGLGPQLGELLLGHVFRGGEELVVLRDLGVGHGFFAVRYGGVGCRFRRQTVVREGGGGECRPGDQGRRTDRRCTTQRHAVE